MESRLVKTILRGFFMRRLCYAGSVLTVLLLFGGCGPNLNSKEFGTIVKGIPHIEGADKPYPLPELGPPPSDDLLRHGHD